MYENKCLKNLDQYISQKDEVVYLFNIFNDKINSWFKELTTSEFIDENLDFIFESSKIMEHVLLNGENFYESLIFLGQILMLDTDNETGQIMLKLNDFSYINILNIDRLKSSYRPKTIDYNYISRCLYNQSISSIWLSLFTTDCLAICFQIQDEKSKNIVIKLMNNNGQQLKENVDYIKSELITMTTFKNLGVLAIRRNSNYYLYLNDSLVDEKNNCSIAYEPILIYCTECCIYILSEEAPFIRVFDWNLKEKNSFGQDLDSQKPYFMQKVIQIFIHNEKMYIRETDKNFIKLFNLKNGYLLNSINLNLLDCLLHIDSFGRIIVINQDSKILYIFDESSKILYEYDLTFIQTINSFCISYNGHLLINDAENKILLLV